ncbi:acetyltransferase [Nocardia asteroides NBRC 15531]|uniref:DUF7144 domain-containing protein n=1 Tax=Nocardia asteroides NBRC 15531 TaxID=1110697 RepID=U5EJ59_NOCAS|nr:hypothetical protein [Nocardia asteroides]TLF67087.1 acetyltransferase [Nocardia asteroides NBRC 15531]UGT51642.1 acetyltransferase [Nocardia asteroides]SFM20775.1 hypothetical protein SAMN05444423_102239 [Nocardia asteroides]VEG35457.1 Uncharacterised protein [Nocardia asteroides]GAD86383.1 hypothetical protein NCAST_32_08700 [Nocardia asteroides NBRC 15531]
MTTSTGRHVSPEEEPFQRQAVAEGISVTAACMLLILATVSVLQGIAALRDDEIYVAGVEYIYQFDTTTWGWIHVVLGGIALICGVGLVLGSTWGRYAAVGIAALVIVANFLSLPYYPAWSIIIIGLSVVIIWAVTAWHPQR